jgi:hypothetical protein
MLPHGERARQPGRGYHVEMARPLVLLLAALAASPARGQGPLEPSGRLPPVASPAAPEPPRKATPAPAPAGPLPRGAVLEPVSGTVREVDRAAQTITVETAGERVTLSMDRNTMVYTPAGLGTVLDVVPGAQIRAGRNADLVAYWVQVRAPAGRAPGPPPAAPGPGPAPGAFAPEAPASTAGGR